MEDPFNSDSPYSWAEVPAQFRGFIPAAENGRPPFRNSNIGGVYAILLAMRTSFKDSEFYLGRTTLRDLIQLSVIGETSLVRFFSYIPVPGRAPGEDKYLYRPQRYKEVNSQLQPDIFGCKGR